MEKIQTAGRESTSLLKSVMALSCVSIGVTASCWFQFGNTARIQTFSHHCSHDINIFSIVPAMNGIICWFVI